MLVDGAITYVLCNDLGFSFASSDLWKGLKSSSRPSFWYLTDRIQVDEFRLFYC